MTDNPVIQTLMKRKSIRKFTDRIPDEDTVRTIVEAGQQAPFAYQLCSLLLSRKREKNPNRAPLLFTVCVDSHRLERIMEKRGWKMVNNDLSLLLLGIQDAALLAENLVIAGESLGLGSCFLGNAPYAAKRIIADYELPKRVFPLVQLMMGYPGEDPPTRPRYPLEFTLFEDRYPEFTPEMIETAMTRMDEGYLAQDYYRRANYMIPLDEKREETFDFTNYSWTEHISRKAGLWFGSPKKLVERFKKCGFDVTRKSR
jgi:FMN reductase (NADPH)